LDEETRIEAMSAREDYLIVYGKSDDSHFMRNSSHEEVQLWLNEYLGPRIDFQVRRDTLDDMCRDVTEDFTPPFDEDEPSPAHSAKIARAEREYRLRKEAV
jgi:hypothetical protein